MGTFEIQRQKCRQLSTAEAKIKPGNENPVDLHEEYAVICSLKFLLPSAMVGTLMGKGGETIRAIRAENECDIQVSPWGSFHPAAAHSQGRTVQCFAESRGALCSSIIAILELIFADDRGAAKFKLILPTKSTSARRSSPCGTPIVVRSHSIPPGR